MLKKLKKYLTDVWFDIDNVFCIEASISLTRFTMCFRIFDKGFDLNFYLHWLPFKWFNIWFKSSESKGYKFWENQISFNTDLETGFSINWRIHGDHPGVESEFKLLGLQYNLNYLDSRHWDYETKRIKIYNK